MVARSEFCRTTLDAALITEYLNIINNAQEKNLAEFIQAASPFAIAAPDANSKKLIERVLEVVNDHFDEWMKHSAIPRVIDLNTLFDQIFYGEGARHEIIYFNDLATSHAVLIGKVQKLAQNAQTAFPEHYFPENLGECLLYTEKEVSPITKLWKGEEMGKAFEYMDEFFLELDTDSLDAACDEIIIKFKLIAQTITLFYLYVVKTWTVNHWKLQATKYKSDEIEKYVQWYQIETGKEFFQWIETLSDSKEKIRWQEHTHLRSILFPSSRNHFNPEEFGEKKSVSSEVLFLKRQKIAENPHLAPLNKAMQELRTFYSSQEVLQLPEKPNFAGLERAAQKVYDAAAAFDKALAG